MTDKGTAGTASKWSRAVDVGNEQAMCVVESQVRNGASQGGLY